MRKLIVENTTGGKSRTIVFPSDAIFFFYEIRKDAKDAIHLDLFITIVSETSGEKKEIIICGIDVKHEDDILKGLNLMESHHDITIVL